WNYSGSNNWVDTYVGGVRQTVGPLSGSAATSNGHATAAGQINGLVISQTDHAHVWGIASDSDWGWALGYSDAGSNWLTAESNNPATVTFSYAYTLDASQASVDWESRVNMYVQVWGGAGNAERLVAPPWTRRASDGVLVFSDSISDGGATNYKTVMGTAQWSFTPVQGQFYSIWAGGDAYAWDAVPEPLTMLGMFLGLGTVGAYIRRRWAL
ncbi:MAG TPA: PEP-CTERM sorting domain-containing protein, partial [Anaerolineae bacterium]|nr:PEP-CTERM sorting domain-containing protein [Anaerolineae bacterium]